MALLSSFSHALLCKFDCFWERGRPLRCTTTVEVNSVQFYSQVFDFLEPLGGLLDRDQVVTEFA
jgi:hypothetical protein